MTTLRHETVDAYIASFPADVRVMLELVRSAVLRAAPGAQERISYQIAAFDLDGRDVVFLAGWKHHVGVYPLPAGDEAFHRDLAGFPTSKGTVRFALTAPIPLDFIERLVQFRVAENAAKGK